MPLNALLNTHYVPKTKTLLALMHARAHPHTHSPLSPLVACKDNYTHTCGYEHMQARAHTHTAHFPIQCHTVTIMEMVANTFK